MKRDGWEIKKLTDICNIQYGYAFDSSCFCDDNSYPQLIRIRDVVRGYSETFYKGNIPEEYYVNKGDYLIGMDGEFHIAPWQSERALLNQRVCKISASDCNVSERFVFYKMSVVLKQIEDETPFVTVKHLSAKRLNQVKIPIPPLSEQSRIVEELDLLSNIIEKKRQQLSELDNLAQSIFYDMFGDPVTANYSKVPLKELSVAIGDGLHGTPNYSEDGECCFINGNNLVEGKIVIYQSTKFVDDNEKKKHYVELDNNTLLVSINGTLGKTAYYNGENIILGKSACYIRLREKVNKVYIYNILCSDYFKKYAHENATGSTIRNVSLKTMRNFLIPMPPIEKQNEYMEKIEALEKQKAFIKQSIAETEELFNSRMDYYFN